MYYISYLFVCTSVQKHNSKQPGALFVRSSNHNKFATQTATQSDSNQYAWFAKSWFRDENEEIQIYTGPR